MSLSRREFLQISAAPLALAGLDAQGAISENEIRLPLIILFGSGGISAKESFNPDEKEVPENLRGPFGTIQTKTTGVRFAECWPELAKISNRFALIRSLDVGTSDHTPGQQHAVLRGKRTVSEQIGERASSTVPYVVLNPGSKWDGLHKAFRINESFSPLWEKGTFKKPEVKGSKRLAERKRLLEDLEVPLSSVPGSRMEKFRSTAFDLLMGGGKFFEALKLDPKERQRYGKSIAGDMTLMARQFVEQGAGAVTVYYEPDFSTFDLHSKMKEGMKRHAYPFDKAAAELIKDISSNRLECVVLLMGEIARTPHVNTSGGRDHWSEGNCAILAGGKIKPSVHGRANKRGEILDGKVMQKDLANTVLVATGAEISPALPRVREVLQSGT